VHFVSSDTALLSGLGIPDRRDALELSQAALHAGSLQELRFVLRAADSPDPTD